MSVLHHYWPWSTDNPLLVFCVFFVPIQTLFFIPIWILRRRHNRQMRQFVYAKRMGKVAIWMRGDGTSL